MSTSISGAVAGELIGFIQVSGISHKREQKGNIKESQKINQGYSYKILD